MIYREIAPPLSLARYVRCLWRLTAPRGAGVAEPVLPDGCMEIVVNVADPFVRHEADGTVARQPLVLLSGQLSRATQLQATGRIDLWGIRLQPWASSTILPGTAASLRDQYVALDCLAPGLGDALLEAIGTLAPARAEHAVFSSIERHIGAAQHELRAVAGLVRLAGSSAQPLSVRALAAMSGLSARRVQMIFRDDVGLSPKQLLRINRLHRVLALAQSPNPPSWAQIAVQTGYFDQAHLIRDARAIAGATPLQLLRMPSELTHAFLGSEDQSTEPM
jgi:AraC-like DNA-binding protein